MNAVSYMSEQYIVRTSDFDIMDFRNSCSEKTGVLYNIQKNA